MENYVHDELVCFYCKRKYALTIQANSIPEALKFFREIQTGKRIIAGYYFTLPIYEFIPPIKCSKCENPGNSGPVHLDWSRQRNTFKQPFITIKQGNKWVRPDRPESRSVEHKTLIALRNRTIDFIADPDPTNHIQSCSCQPCRERKASKNWEPKPLERSYDLKLGIGKPVKKHWEPTPDQIDEMLDNFTFFFRDIAKSVN